MPTFMGELDGELGAPLAIVTKAIILEVPKDTGSLAPTSATSPEWRKMLCSR